MDVQRLRAFMCVAKWKNFTKAAAELFISQPALSKKISEFERELGTPLFLRDNRKLELTPAGQYLYAEAPAFLKIAEDLETRVRELGVRPGSQLRIACTGIEYGRLSRVMAGFRARYPQISVSMLRYSAAEVRRMLLTGMVDFGFQTHFEVEQEPDVEYLPFCRDELAVVLSKDHPLAGEAEISLRQLEDEPYIGIQPQEDHIPFTHMISALCDQGYRPKELRMARSVDELLLCVSCGLGVAHLFMQTREAYGSMVQYIPSSDFRMELEIDLVWNRGNRNPARVKFADHVRALNE